MGKLQPWIIGLGLLLSIPLTGQSDVRFQLSASPSIFHERFDSVNRYRIWLMSAGIQWQFHELGPKLVINRRIDAEYGFGKLAGKAEYDFALMLSTVLEWKATPRTTVTFTLGSGPGFHSTDTDKQARGFIFSNHFTLGLLLPLKNSRILLNPQFGFRHMSNLSFNQPNNGIDHWIVRLGVQYVLPDR